MHGRIVDNLANFFLPISFYGQNTEVRGPSRTEFGQDIVQSSARTKFKNISDICSVSTRWGWLEGECGWKLRQNFVFLTYVKIRGGTGDTSKWEMKLSLYWWDGRPLRVVGELRSGKSTAAKLQVFDIYVRLIMLIVSWWAPCNCDIKRRCEEGIVRQPVWQSETLLTVDVYVENDIATRHAVLKVLTVLMTTTTTMLSC